MKRVLIFSTAYLPFVGGAEIAVKEITDRLGADFEFDMITARINKHLPSKERVGTINVYRLGFGIHSLDKLILPFWGAYKAIKLNKVRGYHIFWSIMVSFAGLAGFFANLFLAFSGHRKKMVLTLQEGDSEEHLKKSRVGLINLSWKFTMRHTDIITAISLYLENRAKKLGYNGRSIVIPNGVNTKHFGKKVDEKEIDILRKKLNKRKDDIFLITVSRLMPKNAISDVVTALYFLPENIKFLILGTGEEKSSLESLAKKREVENRVIFLGHIDHTKLPLYFAVSDIFVRPSLSEGFGNSFVEAMASEVPVIATPVGGIVDFLFDPDKNPNKEPTGLFCTPQNPRSIAEQVIKYLDNPALRTQIILNAKKMVVEKYDWDLIAEEMRSKVFNKEYLGIV